MEELGNVFLLHLDCWSLQPLSSQTPFTAADRAHGGAIELAPLYSQCELWLWGEISWRLPPPLSGAAWKPSWLPLALRGHVKTNPGWPTLLLIYTVCIDDTSESDTILHTFIQRIQLQFVNLLNCIHSNAQKDRSLL